MNEWIEKTKGNIKKRNLEITANMMLNGNREWKGREGERVELQGNGTAYVTC